ncbi:MAG: hypothetical protein CMO04_15370 [Thalassospira sp.]|uniref:sulfite exporter TauE/SafE family protein n=1 Tax=Thalassospira sp. TaxID=1912094 RepID=UPI000C6C02D7|nr:sulfite exporter TauE/SafE family protein [Thalassospira sp.]MAL41250.1 hypothetical protein [Thalassospira sp.]
MSISYVIISGLLLGLASSLHCAGMCGAIASNILVAGGQSAFSSRRQLRTLLLMQLGRAMIYILAGLLVGTLGSTFDALLLTAGWQSALQVTAGLLLIYTGLTLLGFAPPFARLDRFLPIVPLQNLIRPALAGGVSHYMAQSAMPDSSPQKHARLFNPLGTVSLGAVLGITPCAMVYNGLLTAMMTGSGASAALLMACFATAALPAVIVAALGITALHRHSRNQHITRSARKFIALGLIMIGFVTLFQPAGDLMAFCLNIS